MSYFYPTLVAGLGYTSTMAQYSELLAYPERGPESGLMSSSARADLRGRVCVCSGHRVSQ